MMWSSQSFRMALRKSSAGIFVAEEPTVGAAAGALVGASAVGALAGARAGAWVGGAMVGAVAGAHAAAKMAINTTPVRRTVLYSKAFTGFTPLV